MCECKQVIDIHQNQSRYSTRSNFRNFETFSKQESYYSYIDSLIFTSGVTPLPVYMVSIAASHFPHV